MNGGVVLAAHPRRIEKTSEFIGIVLVLLSVGLQKIAPIDPPALVNSSHWAPFAWPATGLVLVGSFAVVLRATHAELARYEQPHEPGRPTTRLVTTGPFAFSRNPTYASIALLLQPGLAMIFGNAWMVILMPLAMVLFWHVMIREEEEYLRIKFRGEWEAYCLGTRRWV